MVPERLRCLAHLVGHTPLLAITVRLEDRVRTVYAKYEVHNYTGSIKDRMALSILEEAYRSGSLGPDHVIAEATSGNTGIAFAALGRALGHEVRIYMPDWMSRERVLLIQSHGATVIPVSTEEGGFLGSIALADDYAEREPDVFLPHQFSNEANVRAHYRTTGPEILAQLESRGLRPTAFVAGVGTGGTVMGVGRYLRETLPSIAVHPLEPANSPTLRTGTRTGKHRIQGISDEFIPQIVRLAELDRIIDVWDGEAIAVSQALAHRFGLGVGISSGANLHGAIQLAFESEAGVVTTVFADCNKKYLSTDLARREPLAEDSLAARIELLDFEVIPAVRVALA
ncbi:MAG: cysteine synthase family protein [Planctomycetes bacterium]|nr:cysteine synthase family protein [Planctomycetota bacterium]